MKLWPLAGFWSIVEPSKQLVCATSNSNCITRSARKSLKKSTVKELQVFWCLISLSLCFQAIQPSHLNSQQIHLAVRSTFGLSEPLIAVDHLPLTRLHRPPRPPWCYRSCVIIFVAYYLFLISCWGIGCINITLTCALPSLLPYPLQCQNCFKVMYLQ